VRNRWYDPAVGRFISEDPIGIAGGTNLYTYGGNDPINHRDPSGTDWFCYPVWVPQISTVCVGDDCSEEDDGYWSQQCDYIDDGSSGGSGGGTTSSGGGGTGGGGTGGKGGTGKSSPPPKSAPPPKSVNSFWNCAGQALGNNWKGLGLDAVGWAANLALPEGSAAMAVTGSLLGVAGIGVAVADNRGRGDALVSGSLAYTGKEAAVFEGALRGAASQVASRVGIGALALSTGYDLAKTGMAYNACMTGSSGH
jgi:hypothetical protein